MLLLVALTWGRVAWAQQAGTPDAFALAPPQRGASVQGWGAEPLAPGRFSLVGSVHTRPSPAWSAPEGQGGADVFGLSTVGLLGGFGGPEGFDVWGGMTVVDANADGSRLETQVPASPGHARLVLRFSPLTLGERQRAALLLDSALPLRRGPMATEGPRFEPRLALSGSYDWVRTVLNTGYRVHLGGDSGRGFDAFTWVAGAVIPVTDEWEGVTELAGCWYPSGSSQAWQERMPTEARTAARFARASWAVELGAGLNLVGGEDEPSFRMFAAVSVSPPPQPARHEGQQAANPSSSLASEDDECARALLDWNGGEIPAACDVTGVSQPQ